MRFNELTTNDLEYIKAIYSNNPSNKADRIISENFDAAERTIRGWANRLGLTRGSKVEDIEVNPLADIEVDYTFVEATSSQQDGELWLILPDVHRPFHNKVVWRKIMNIISDLGESLTGIVLSGDYLDLFTLGSYNANSLGLLKGITLEDEYRDGRQGIDELQSRLHPNTSRVYLFGNHEDRYFREMNKQDNAKYGNSLKDPIEALNLKEYGWKVLTNWKDDVYTIGDIDITHGVYCNIHASQKHLAMNGASVMFGHTHRWGVFCNGEELGYNIGCLIDLNSPYFNYMPRMQRNVWTNGFSFISVDSDNNAFPELVKVENSEFYWRGRKY